MIPHRKNERKFINLPIAEMLLKQAQFRGFFTFRLALG
jgi:hypothetical protein